MAEVTEAYSAYVRTAEAKMCPSLEIDFPHASRSISTLGGVMGGRLQQPWLTSLEGPALVVAKRPGQLATTQIQATIADPDGTLTDDLEAHSSRFSPVRLYSSSPFLDHDDWGVTFIGVLDDWQLQPDAVVIVAKPAERALRRNVPSVPLLRGDWPNAPAASPPYGLYPPAIYGVHDSRSTSGTGFIPTVCVEYNNTDSRWRWLVSAGYLPGVPRVYAAGVLKTLTTDYVLSRVEVGGNLWTLIDWTTAGHPAVDAVVTCDVEGYETVGDGSGTNITNPVAQIRHWANNFAFGSYRRGLWATSSGSVDAESFSFCEGIADAYALEGSMRVGGTVDQRSAEDVFRDWMHTWLPFRVRWGQDNKLHMGILNPANRQASRIWLRPEMHREIPRLSNDSAQAIGGVGLSHIYDEAAGRYWASLRLQDHFNDEPADDPFDLRYSAARTL